MELTPALTSGPPFSRWWIRAMRNARKAVRVRAMLRVLTSQGDRVGNIAYSANSIPRLRPPISPHWSCLGMQSGQRSEAFK